MLRSRNVQATVYLVTLNMAQMLEFSETIKRGSGKQQAPQSGI